MSQALVSEMQKRGNIYLNLDEDLEYRSLYGEKNPNQESKRIQDALVSLAQKFQK